MVNPQSVQKVQSQENTLQQPVTTGTIISELVEQHPEVIDTLLGLGVHCLGCGASLYESVGEGLRSHGMNEQEIAEAVAEMNKVITSQVSGNPAIVKSPGKIRFTVTEAAAGKIRDFCAKSGKRALRVGIKRGGCSGYSYLLELADAPTAKDIVLEDKSATLFIDAASAEKLDGSEIDYLDSLQGAGFRINNPQAGRGCGCGNSFGF